MATAIDVENVENEHNSICWQCSEFCNVFPFFMCTIRNIKAKKKNEDSIVEWMINSGNVEIVNRDTINNIFEYSIDLGYIKKSFYKDHYSYNIKSSLENVKECSLCSETITPFNCDTFNVNSGEKRYVDIQIFEQLAKEVYDIKIAIKKHSDGSTDNGNTNIDHVKSLEREIAYLKEVISTKDRLIESVITKNNLTDANVKPPKENKSQDDYLWHEVNYRRKGRINTSSKENNQIPMMNRFNNLPTFDDELDAFNNLHYNDDANVLTNSWSSNSNNNINGILAGVSGRRNEINNRRPNPVVQEVDEISPQRPRTVPGNRSYADISSRGKRTLVIGASLVRYINIREFNKNVVNGYAIK